jgi:hypothetical protein
LYCFTFLFSTRKGILYKTIHKIKLNIPSNTSLYLHCLLEYRTLKINPGLPGWGLTIELATQFRRNEFCCEISVKYKKIKQSHYRSWETLSVPVGLGSQISRKSAHKRGKVASYTHRPPLPPGYISGTHFCKKLSRAQDHIAAGRIMSMKNSNDTVGNRTCELPVCSAVPQPT